MYVCVGVGCVRLGGCVWGGGWVGVYVCVGVVGGWVCVGEVGGWVCVRVCMCVGGVCVTHVYTKTYVSISC